MFHKKLSTQHAREGSPEIAVYKMYSDGSLKNLECKLKFKKKKKLKKKTYKKKKMKKKNKTKKRKKN